MAEQFDAIQPAHRDFIARQHLFFTASAAAEGRVNLSPKGLDCFRILGERGACYLDLTGSGNETAAHTRADGRLTIMFCAFDGRPLILRLYGRSRILRRGGVEYGWIIGEHFGGVEMAGARQIVAIDIDLVQTSCGYGVPAYEYRGERPSLLNWAAARGEESLETFRRSRNNQSMDGLPTGLFDAEEAAAGELS